MIVFTNFSFCRGTFIEVLFFCCILITFLFPEFSKMLDSQLYDFKYTSSNIYVRFLQLDLFNYPLYHLYQFMFSAARNYVLTCVVPD